MFVTFDRTYDISGAKAIDIVAGHRDRLSITRYV